MPQLSRAEMWMYAACAVLVAVLGWKALQHEGSPPTVDDVRSPGPQVSVSEAPARIALVHVVGAVRHPGVYRLRGGQRVQDAIKRAGGVRPGADVQAINLAAKVADAQQVVVPRRASSPAGTGPSSDGGPGLAASGAVSSGPVNLNSATVEQLDTLDGVGPATAQKILEYRTQHGGFSSVDDLAQIPGIGPKRLESLRVQVQV